MAEVGVAEEERRLKKKKRVRTDEQAAIETSSSAPTPGSFSLSSKNKVANDDDEKPTAPPPATAPVIVNVGTTGQGGSSGNAPDIGWLAAFVLDGPTYMRDSRMRTAVDMIRASCKTDEERTDIANKLDAELAKREPKDDGGAFNRSARVAYDKLKNFFK